MASTQLLHPLAFTALLFELACCTQNTWSLHAQETGLEHKTLCWIHYHQHKQAAPAVAFALNKEGHICLGQDTSSLP